MMKTPEDTRPETWQRHFARIANDQGWALAESADGPVDATELLNAAHASAWHWQVVGTELNHMRARMLLAQAHALAGHGATAFGYAEQARAYFLGRPDTPDWELAFVHAIHAHAAAVAGRKAPHADSYAAASRAVEAIADPEDREIVLRTYRKVPTP